MNAKNNPTPTDLELMLYADGELEGEQLAVVEAYVARDPSARRKLLAMGIVSDVVRSRAHDVAAPLASGIADAVMAAIEAEAAPRAPAPKAVDAPPARPPAKVVPLRRRPANDGRLWALAGVAAAAAAALLVWSRGPTGGPGVAKGPGPALTAPHEDPARIEPASRADENDHGVEVAAVDFGARTGSVFYVPSGTASSSTTTVVWLSDDPSGGNE
jgi:anti-sigma factor RsiW